MRADQIRRLTSPSDRSDDVERMGKLARVRPDNQEATLVLIEGIASPQWRITLGCCQALARTPRESRELAINALQEALRRPEDCVRREASKSLQALSRSAKINLLALDNTLLGEECPLAAASHAQAIASALAAGHPRRDQIREKLLSLLDRILSQPRTVLPFVELPPGLLLENRDQRSGTNEHLVADAGAILPHQGQAAFRADRGLQARAAGPVALLVLGKLVCQ